jgi:hypothetical protein
MKANLKGRGLKGLLLMHGEKVGIAVVGLISLWLVYSSLSAPRLEPRYQASKLDEQINQTKATVRDAEWPAPDSELASNVRYAKEVAKDAVPKVNSKLYRTSGAGFTAVIPPTQRRTDPPLLNAIEVRATGGSGLFAFVDEAIRRQQELKQRALEEERAKEAEKLAQQQQQQAEQGRPGRRGREAPGEMAAAPIDPDHPNRRAVMGMTQPAGVPLQGGERIERAYWATVVAKVPIRDQLKLYQDAFENARGYDPASDFPRYKGYMVERSEVVRGKPLEWKPVPVYDAQRKSIDARKPIAPVVSEKAVSKLYEIMKEWAGQAIEPVDSRYIDSVLTLPLPPLVGRDWGADATHPDIPLAINAPPPEVEPLEAEVVEQPADADDPESQFRSDPNQQGFGPRPGSFGPGFGRFPGGERGGIGPGYGEMGMRPYMSSEMMGERGYPGGFGGPGGQRGVLPSEVSYWLLRFFDFTVEPGKKYRYRVKLVLADPNHGLPDSTLDPAVQDRLRTSKKKDYRIAEEWSEPSPTVGIPLMGAVHLAEAKLPGGKTFNDEPVAKLMIETFNVDADGTAVHIAKEKDFRRGYVMNLKEKLDYTGDGDRWIDTFEEPYEIATGVTVLDVSGGDRLTKDMTAPSRVLLMDASGELMIRNELDDSTSVEYLRMLFADDKQRAGAEGLMPGMPFPGPGIMPFRGGGPRER